MSESQQEVFNEGEWSSDAKADISAVLAALTLIITAAVIWVSSQ